MGKKEFNKKGTKMRQTSKKSSWEMKIEKTTNTDWIKNEIINKKEKEK